MTCVLPSRKTHAPTLHCLGSTVAMERTRTAMEGDAIVDRDDLTYGYTMLMVS